MKKNSSNRLLVLVFLAGIALLLYPSLSDYWNSFHQTQAIASYVEDIVQLDEQTYNTILDEARAYNKSIIGKKNRYILNDDEQKLYESLLNVSGSGVMGYIDIPKIKCSLPIYHGTDDSVLQVAIGHIAGSSLPVGGLSTHCVISGHRGLPSAKLFTNLDRLVEGDLFTLEILDENLTYKVDQILIVEPEEVEALNIIEGKDYCTLVTCTPYGVNSHRLLVRGVRVEEQEAEKIRVSSDAVQIEPLYIAPILAVPMLLLILMWLLIRYRK